MLRIILLVVICLYAVSVPGQVNGPQILDVHGDYTGIKGTATGRWHTEQIIERQWFVTPGGNAMYVLGINHVQASGNEGKKQAIENLKRWNFNTCGQEKSSGISAWLLRQPFGQWLQLLRLPVPWVRKYHKSL